MVALTNLVNFSQRSLHIATASIIFNPLFWNIVSIQEHKNRILTKLAFGNRYWACYGLAVTIFSLGLLRDHLYQVALSEQPKLALLANGEFKLLAVLCFGAGGILVLSSMWALGITGTFLGDRCGILMDERVESFPFNVTDNPMYWGSTLSFLGTAIWFESPAGLLLTGLVFVVYKIALQYEEPFTAKIYAAREAKRASASKRAVTSGKSSALRSKGEL